MEQIMLKWSRKLTFLKSLEPRRIFLKAFDNPFSNSTCIIMLSNQTTDLYTQHRRTNSTPTSQHVASKVSVPPADSVPQQGSHRRGLTLDQSILALTSPQQDNGPVYTNQGPQAQYNIRETQQHAMARPGQHTIQIPHNSIEKENCQYLTISPLMTPSLDQSTFETSSYSTNPTHIENQQRHQYQQNNNTIAPIARIPSSRDLEDLDDGINKYIRDVENNVSKAIFCSDSISATQPLVSISKDIRRPFTPPAQSSTSKLEAKCFNAW